MYKKTDKDGWAIIHQNGLWTIKQHPTEKNNLVVAGAVYGKRDVNRGGDYEYWWDIDRCDENWQQHLDEKGWWDDASTMPETRCEYDKDIAKTRPNKRSDFIQCLSVAKEIFSRI